MIRLLIWASLLYVCACEGRRAYYRTEPDFRPENFIFTTKATGHNELAPGYYFIAPMTDPHGYGPQIYDNDGVLIWHGNASYKAQNSHACDYLGERGTHLCYSHIFPGHKLPRRLYKNEPKVPRVGAYPKNVVLDHTYTPVAKANITEGFYGLPLDTHAFETHDDGYISTFINHWPKTQDLRPYGGDEHGWVIDQCFGALDNRSRNITFHWCFLDAGLEIWETYVFILPNDYHWWSNPFHIFDKNLTAWTHDWWRTMGQKWDFIHMNAVEKDDRGNYLVSIRHLDQILKIAGPGSADGAEPGTILWRLGGKKNEFRLTGDWPFPDVSPFSRQHDVRFLGRDGDEELLSVFNNGWDSYFAPRHPYSSGVFFAVNSAAKTARFLRHYPHPSGKVVGARGSTRQLPNGNVLVGWGDHADFTEFAPNGTVLQHIMLDQTGEPNTPKFSYRVSKSPWKGQPKTDPLVVAHLRPCNIDDLRLTLRLSLDAYASWNGATEVSKWRFSMASSRNGPWTDAGTFKKDGYETQADLIKTYSAFKAKARLPFVRAEALNSDGEVIGSAVTRAVVHVEWVCEHWILASFLALLLVFAVVEAFGWFGRCCYRGSAFDRRPYFGKRILLPQNDET